MTGLPFTDPVATPAVRTPKLKISQQQESGGGLGGLPLRELRLVEPDGRGSPCQRRVGLGLDAAAALTANDSTPFFEALDDLIVTGPTGTNVMDIQVVLIPE